MTLIGLHGAHELYVSDRARHAAWIEEDASLGITAIYLHDIGDNQERLIKFYVEQVIPQISPLLIRSCSTTSNTEGNHES